MKTSPGCSGIARHAASVSRLVMGSIGIDVEGSSTTRSSVDPISPCSQLQRRGCPCLERWPHTLPFAAHASRQTCGSSATAVPRPVSTVGCVRGAPWCGLKTFFARSSFLENPSSFYPFLTLAKSGTMACTTQSLVCAGPGTHNTARVVRLVRASTPKAGLGAACHPASELRGLRAPRSTAHVRHVRPAHHTRRLHVRGALPPELITGGAAGGRIPSFAVQSLQTSPYS